MQDRRGDLCERIAGFEEAVRLLVRGVLRYMPQHLDHTRLGGVAPDRAVCHDPGGRLEQRGKLRVGEERGGEGWALQNPVWGVVEYLRRRANDGSGVSRCGRQEHVLRPGRLQGADLRRDVFVARLEGLL